jgi:hypothetical protein
VSGKRAIAPNGKHTEMRMSASMRVMPVRECGSMKLPMEENAPIHANIQVGAGRVSRTLVGDQTECKIHETRMAHHCSSSSAGEGRGVELIPRTGIESTPAATSAALPIPAQFTHVILACHRVCNLRKIL